MSIGFIDDTHFVILSVAVIWITIELVLRRIMVFHNARGIHVFVLRHDLPIMIKVHVQILQTFILVLGPHETRILGRPVLVITSSLV